jgi:hypothetical protein
LTVGGHFKLAKLMASQLSDMDSTAPDYLPAVLFLLASGLLVPLFYLLLSGPSTSSFVIQISVLIMLILVVTLICGVLVRDVRFYAFVIIAIGLTLRAASVVLLPISSDVLTDSATAASLILSGENPYQVLATPPGKFTYPPLEPLFYIPFLSVDPRWAEFTSGSVILLILLITALRSENKSASVLYLAIYSFSILMSGIVGISTNDTSASLFPFLAIWIIMFSSARRKFDYAGVLLGLGVAFKQFAIFPLIFAIGFLIKSKGPWLKTAALATLTIALISLPFLLLNPMNFLSKVIIFNFTERTVSPYFVLAAVYPQLLGPWLLILQLSITTILAVGMFSRIRNWSECQIAWTSIFLLSLFLGRYVAPSYFCFVMPFWILAGISPLTNQET